MILPFLKVIGWKVLTLTPELDKEQKATGIYFLVAFLYYCICTLITVKYIKFPGFNANKLFKYK